MKSFIERQKLSAESEKVICSHEGNEKAKEFLQRTWATGHRYIIRICGIPSKNFEYWEQVDICMFTKLILMGFNYHISVLKCSGTKGQPVLGKDTKF